MKMINYHSDFLSIRLTGDMPIVPTVLLFKSMYTQLELYDSVSHTVS